MNMNFNDTEDTFLESVPRNGIAGLKCKMHM